MRLNRSRRIERRGVDVGRVDPPDRFCQSTTARRFGPSHAPWYEDSALFPIIPLFLRFFNILYFSFSFRINNGSDWPVISHRGAQISRRATGRGGRERGQRDPSGRDYAGGDLTAEGSVGGYHSHETTIRKSLPDFLFLVCSL